MTAIVVGTIALPFLVFGTFVALGGEGSILAGGAIIAVICTALLLCLAVLLLVHGYLEATNHRVPFTGDGDARTLAVDGIRTTEMIAAGVFICGLAAALVLVAVRGEIPTALPFIVIVAAIAQSVAVLIHATGRAVSYLLRDG
ncbi:hypothetical protein [Halorubrum coriense]|uniref:hypothetical protein n=1 Tax=Halorubrum coriense TaxID=64713 RepID=UPI000677896C|nr:hypothetical protein [Halorubrum coriense]